VRREDTAVRGMVDRRGWIGMVSRIKKIEVVLSPLYTKWEAAGEIEMRANTSCPEGRVTVEIRPRGENGKPGGDSQVLEFDMEKNNIKTVNIKTATYSIKLQKIRKAVKDKQPLPLFDFFIKEV